MKEVLSNYRISVPAAGDRNFNPDLLALQAAPPARWPRGSMIAISTLILMALFWAAFAKLDIVIVAQGRLIPTSYTKPVQSAVSGVIVQILVADGKAVAKDQVLMHLDARLNSVDVDALKRELSIKQWTLRRIEAEITEKPFFSTQKAPTEFAQQILAQYQARRLSYLDAISQETENLNKAIADLKSSEQLADKLRSILPILQQNSIAYERLYRDGFVGEILLNEKRREYIEKQQDLKLQDSNGIGLKAVIAAQRKKLSAIGSNYRSQLQNERVDLLAQINRTESDVKKLALGTGLLEIKAPSAGIVKDLIVTSPGAVIQAGIPLLNLVPINDKLIAEIQLANEDVGFINVGQDAKIKIAAYPFQKFGLLEGKLALISADSTNNSSAQSVRPLLSYKALLDLDSQQLSTPNGQHLSLVPGMLVTAEIHQGTRTVLEYLLSPVQRVADESARER